jgi:flavodoxin
MRAVVIYESLTGKTRRAAGYLAGELTRLGVPALAYPVDAVDLDDLAAADLVVVGGWVSGHFVVGQKPGRRHRLEKMPQMGGKKAAVFCTFALDPGKTVEKLTAIVEAKGAEVVGGMSIRRDDLAGGAIELAGRLVDALSAEPAGDDTIRTAG